MLTGIARRTAHEAVNVAILARAGLLAPGRPDRMARLGVAAARWGGSLATLVKIGAIRHGDRTMVLDDRGALTYAEVDLRSDAVARGLAAAGVRPGDRVGVMCRDHRGFLDAAFGVAKAGADLLLLNTSFAGPQLAAVCEREGAAAIIHDGEFTGLVADAARGRTRIVAWFDGDGEAGGDHAGEPTLDGLIEAHASSGPPPPPPEAGHVTILTSGTTGTPKGAARTATPHTLDPAVTLLDRIPLRTGQTVSVAAPLFHAWGFGGFVLTSALGGTLVLRRRFDPAACLADIERHRSDVLVVVPVMLQRILALDPAERRRYDTRSLTAVCSSGSALPGELATRWMDDFGDNLYNMYGSTEVAVATLATPADLRAAPGTAGRPARGSIVRLFDAEDREVGPGETGRIFVGNAVLFDGYTGGGDKARIGELMATGDVGRIDGTGRLFVQGRDDEMIVSGGENVFPKEVEDVLAEHPAVAEAAAIGIPDEEFGQRLRAFVALAEGRSATDQELKDHVRAELARYKVPREVVFVTELPRTTTGKVLKRELADHG